MKPQHTRIETLDIIRGMAIAMMVFTHFYGYIVDPHEIDMLQFARLDGLASWWCVPLFYFIIGYTLVIQIDRKSRDGYSNRELRKYILVRSFLIYCYGIILNMYQLGLQYIWHWSTLQIISIGYIVTYVLRNTSNFVRILLSIAILFTSFALAPYYGAHRYQGEWDLLRFVEGLIYSGGNPIFPWIVYFLIGSILPNLKIRKIGVIQTCFILVLLLTVAIMIRKYIPITKYPATLTYNLVFMSASILLFVVIFWVREIKRSGVLVFYSFKVFGMYPLTIFMGHIIIGMYLIKFFNIFRQGNLVEFLLIYVMTFIFIVAIGHLWQKNEFKYSLDWLLRWFSYKAMKHKEVVQ
jgi:surface polysaccharide O-acyltransferase-like enzyme